MKKVLPWVLGVLGMLLAISLAVTLTLNARWLYLTVMEIENIPEASGYSREEILENYDALIEYNSLFFVGELEFPTLPMSEGGRIHFVEVKNIFVAIEIIGIVAFVLLGAYTAYSIKMRDRSALLTLRNTGILTVAVPAVVALGVAINWDAAFVIFHKIFFRNDLWIFNYNTDPVIRILPDEYFLACAIMIISIVVLWSVLCTVLYLILRKKLMK